MNDTKVTLIITVIVIIVLIETFAIIYFLKRKLQNRIKEIKLKFNGGDILYQENFANFHGVASKGWGQIRGNGIFVVTKNELFFSLLIPKREFLIPLKNITKINTASSFLGHSKIKALVKIEFTNEQGQADAMGIYVKDSDKVIKIIEENLKH